MDVDTGKSKSKLQWTINPETRNGEEQDLDPRSRAGCAEVRPAWAGETLLGPWRGGTGSPEGSTAAVPRGGRDLLKAPGQDALKPCSQGKKTVRDFLNTFIQLESICQQWFETSGIFV